MSDDLQRLSAEAGVGLRSPHVAEVLRERPRVPWFEVHSENHFVDGGAALATLLRLRADYPVSLHGVGLSLGATDPLDREHVAKLRRLIDRVAPVLVSEHLSFGSAGGRHVNDLLPLPYTEETLAHVSARVDAAQHLLGHALAIENISQYVVFPEDTIPECEFIAALARRTGCKLLLDLNNVYVNAVNQGFDPDAYVAAIPGDAVVEIHLAGFEAGDTCLIDTHGTAVAPAVWRLYERTIERIGARPTLIEWDSNIPALDVLLAEAAKAEAVLRVACPGDTRERSGHALAA